MKKRLTLILTALILCMGAALAQTKVTGTVIAEDDGEPVVGAAVKVLGTNLGVVTDLNGRFSITVPSGRKHLRVSYVGMETKDVDVKENVKVVLRTDARSIDEVIVVAYGTQKKSAFTGSAAQIDSKKIEDHVTSNVTSALAGNTPGVQILSTSGDPADNEPTIRVRGIGSMSASNKPLYILDGVPYDGPISAVNPNDVASMSVLKDAAASAIYGARGANGVVLITTKKGRSQDAEVKFDAKWGSNSRLIPQYDVISDPGQYYETAYRQMFNSQYYNGKSLAESYAYADANLLNANNGGLGYLVYTVPEGEKLIGTNFKLNPNAKLGYSDGEYYYTPDDWYDEAFHNSFRQEYNVSLSGVTDRINYYASAGYLKDGGIVNNSDMERYTARLNVDYQVKQWFKVGTNMGYAHTDSNSPSYDTDTYMSSGNLFYICNNMGPIYPLYVRDANGNIMTEKGRTVYDSNQTNFKRPSVVGNAVRDNEVNTRKAYRDVFTGKFSAIFTPFEGLTLSANLSVTADQARHNNLYSEFGAYSSTDGLAEVYNTREFGVTNQYLANYQTTIAKDHNIDVLVGYEQYKYKYQYFYGYNDHLYDPIIGELGNATGTGDSKYLTSYTNNYMTEGIISRLQYDYKEKYFLSASYRRDASSRFAKGHRWGNFGSLGLAWDMKKEFFLADVKWLDQLKLKASYGIQGNDAILTSDGYANYYAYTDLYTPSYNAETNTYSNVLTQKGNEDLTWETSKSLNIGVDFSVFKSRLTGTLEYFRRETSDMLYYKKVPASSGIVTGEYPVNVGTMVNQGFEFSLDGTIIKTRNLQWDMNLNLSHYTNEITSLDASVSAEGIKGSYYIRRVGGSMYNAYLYKYAGVNEEGKALYYYEVKDEDGNVTGIDTTTDFSKASQFDCGTTLPDLFGGWGTTLRAYGFDLSAQVSFQLGGRIYDGTYQALMHTSSQTIGSAWHKDALDAWSPENTSSDIPRLDSDYSVGQSAVDRFQTSSDYLSINNVTLGYTLPRRLLDNIGISALRVYVAGENLAVFSARKGLDPRFSFGTGSYVYGSGASSNYYAAMRTITAGVSLSF